MRMLLLWVGRLSGLAGVLLTAAAVLGRLGGAYQLGSFDTSSVLTAGIAGMVTGCLAYVAAIAEQPRSGAQRP